MSATRLRVRHVVPMGAPLAGHRADERCPACTPRAHIDMLDGAGGAVVWVHVAERLPEQREAEPLVAWEGGDR